LTSTNSHELSLLSKTELEWLLGNKRLSKSFGYKSKSTIKKKIDNFLSFELPLLIQTQILDKQLVQNILDKQDSILPNLVRKRSRDQIPLKAFNNSSMYDEFRMRDSDRYMVSNFRNYENKQNFIQYYKL
jgi:hypothetical protein